MKPENSQLTISEIVQNDYRTADVFRKYGINYCCGGNETLEKACGQKNLKPADLRGELDLATRNFCLPSATKFEEWSVDFLIEYIIHIHHAYLSQTLPALNQLVASFVQGHIKKYPELEPVPQIVEELSSLLLEYLQKEEESLFPYLKQISNTYKRKETYGRLFVRTLSKPLNQAKQLEQTHISALIHRLRSVTGNYQFRKDACTNYKVVFQKLQELDNDIVQHNYLENTILIPKAMAMEEELLLL